MYERRHIQKIDLSKVWYAHNFHFDKAYSRNMLKIIIPINIDEKGGPLIAIDKRSSKSSKDIKKALNNKKHLIAVGKCKKIYGFYPNVCWHKDGIPEKGYFSSQIMLQLNPSLSWSYNKNLFKRQGQEKRFPLLSYAGEKRIRF